MTPPVDLREFLPGYLAEVEEHLRGATSELTTIDAAARKGESRPRAVRSLFRALHTIKGLSAMVSVDPIVDIAHAMETLLRDADRAGGALSPRAMDPLLAGLRAIEHRVGALSRGEAVPAAPHQLLESLSTIPSAAGGAVAAAATLDLPEELLAKLTEAEREELARASSSGKSAFWGEFVPSKEKAEAGRSITTVREQVGALGEIVRVLPLSVSDGKAPASLKFVLLIVSGATAEALAAAGLEEVRSVGGAPALPDVPVELEDDGVVRRQGIVRVDVVRLDETLERLSALVVSRMRIQLVIESLATSGVDVRALEATLDEDARRLRDLRASLLALRMIRLREVLEPMPLLLRGLSVAAKKPARLDIDTGAAELDKSVAERVLPALVHLVRNAVDHGLESPEDRVRAGKPEIGTITIRAVARGGRDLQLTIDDDGRGVDAVAVARHAGRPVPTTDSELLDLLTMAGLSTRDAADKTSGRGFGMNIVRRATEELGGHLSLDNRPGLGATFTLRIPVTVTIMDALRLECANERFVVPVANVEEVFEVEASRTMTGPNRTRGVTVRMVERRGHAVPLVSLRSMLGLPGTGKEERALLVIRQGEYMAFSVERLLGKSEVVVRPLLDPLLKVNGVSGATDLGDGHPTLVLDLVALAGRLQTRSAQA